MNNNNIIVPLISSFICSFFCLTDLSEVNQLVGLICTIISTLVAVAWIVVKIYNAMKDGKITDEEKKDIEDSIDDLKK